MSAYVVFQITSVVPDGALPNPAVLTAWLVEADDEPSAVTMIVELGIVTSGTVHALAIAETQSFDIATNPDVTPADDPLVPK
jgi:hypothetical protein